MIYEYALEPEFVATWGNLSDYRYFTEKFGLGHPRMVSEYPKRNNWKSRVVRTAIEGGVKDLELQRVTALIGLLTERMVLREGRTFDGAISWLENTEREHQRCSFYAILARFNPRNHPDVLIGLTLHTDPRWNPRRSTFTPRKPRDMARTVAPMLSNCATAIFVDPHFGPENLPDRRPIIEFLYEMTQNRGGPPPAVVEIHTSAKSPPAFFKKACEEQMACSIPQGLRVCFRRWREKPEGEKLHNRYILTDLGGVTFGIGLDDGQRGQTDDVILMDRELYEYRWSQYVGYSPAFELAEEPVVVVGAARQS